MFSHGLARNSALVSPIVLASTCCAVRPQVLLKLLGQAFDNLKQLSTTSLGKVGPCALLRA
eukprot:9987413-Alexandrium_andersonii.AAC.1